jgi:hypothetical protein
MSGAIFPIARPESGEDSRFTFGLTFDVLEVLAEHGYPDARSSAQDNVEMQEVLFRFIYGTPSTRDHASERGGRKIDDTTWVGLTSQQANGTACVVCGRDHRRSATAHVPVGYALLTASQVFACEGACAEVAGAQFDPSEGER